MILLAKLYQIEWIFVKQNNSDNDVDFFVFFVCLNTNPYTSKDKKIFLNHKKVNTDKKTTP